MVIWLEGDSVEVGVVVIWLEGDSEGDADDSTAEETEDGADADSLAPPAVDVGMTVTSEVVSCAAAILRKRPRDATSARYFMMVMLMEVVMLKPSDSRWVKGELVGGWSVQTKLVKMS